MAPRELLSFWFTFSRPVDRGAYLRHGASLMAAKYAGDALLVGVGAGIVWTPLDYLRSVPLLVAERLSDASPLLAPALAAWTLPFLWIGLSMTIRRLLDAGRSAWWSLLFFVPGLSYLLMAALVFAPSRPLREVSPTLPTDPEARLPGSLLSIAAAGAVGLAMAWVGVMALNTYGLALFMGSPFVVGLTAGYTLCRRYPATIRETLEVVTMALLVSAGAAFLIGFEGAVCLVMVAPLGIGVAWMGGVVGRVFAGVGERPAPGAALLLVLFPGAVSLEAGASGAVLREVRSSVVVEATPLQVWDHVVAFSPIPEPTDLLFRLGLAYPMHARIEGAGVGAVRYCVFSTGAFVEPITAWEPGVRLAFDVVESPPPLRELSMRGLRHPLGGVAPPHLEGYLVPRRGEFRLIDLGDGRTRLEGSTWYEQRLRPEGYWVMFSDRIIARIHERVLMHIAAEASEIVEALGEVEVHGSETESRVHVEHGGLAMRLDFPGTRYDLDPASIPDVARVISITIRRRAP